VKKTKDLSPLEAAKLLGMKTKAIIKTNLLNHMKSYETAIKDAAIFGASLRWDESKEAFNHKELLEAAIVNDIDFLTKEIKEDEYNKRFKDLQEKAKNLGCSKCPGKCSEKHEDNNKTESDKEKSKTEVDKV